MAVNSRIALASVFLAVTVPAQAADLPLPGQAVVVDQPAAAARWSVAVAPYLWAAGLKGDVAQFGAPAVSIDASFSDIFDHLDFGAMFVAEVRYDRFGLFIDFAYVKLSGSRATPLGVIADSVTLDSETLMFTAAPEYRILESPLGTLDLMAGIRVWDVQSELFFTGGLLNGFSASDGDTWVDPLVGAKGRYNLTDAVFLTGWGMVGGFGVSSDIMWDVFGGVGYQFNDRFSAVVGYRAVGVDYSNDAFLFERRPARARAGRGPALLMPHVKPSVE